MNSIDPSGLDRIYIKDGQVYWQPQRTAWGGWWNEAVGEAIRIGTLDGDVVWLEGKAEWASRRGNKNSFTMGSVGLRELRDLAAQTNRYFGTATKATVEANIDNDITALHGGGALATSFSTGFGRGLETGGKAVVNAGMDTGIGFITLGTQDGQQYHIPVTQEDLDNGYTTSMIIARFSQELGLVRLHFASEDGPFALLFQEAITKKLVTDVVFSEVRPFDDGLLRLLKNREAVTTTHCEALSVLIPVLRNQFMHGTYLLSRVSLPNISIERNRRRFEYILAASPEARHRLQLLVYPKQS